MSVLVIRTMNGKRSIYIHNDPFKPHEKPLNPTLRTIELTDEEATWPIDVLAMALEFGTLENQ